ncbi:MAG: MBL fold metallo-hydrolase [Bacteroidales bacterium]|nr:MBL fold metallo-hydrolase [Bacteroidales bacterium]
MHIHITTLVENYVSGKKLKGEHGLSFFIDMGPHRFLFDTGGSDLLLSNAETLGIDLSSVDFIILSHGHNDHTGGLEYFFSVNKKAKIIAKREVMERKFNLRTEIGLPALSSEILDRFIFVDRFVEYIPGLFIVPQIDLVFEEDTHFKGFFIEKRGEREQDLFDDELAVVLKTKKGYALLTACSHRGITNMVEQLKTHFNLLHLELILGGFHLRRSPKEVVDRVSDYLLENVKGSIGVCHCSGIDTYSLFKTKFADRVFYNYTGKEIKLEL